MLRQVRIFGGLILLLSTTGWLMSQPASSRVAQLEITLPAEAQLQINDWPTETTGPVRRFQTLPLERETSFRLHAQLKAKSVTKTVTVKPSSLLRIDLHPDFAAETIKPKPSLSMQCDSVLVLKPGEKKPISVTVKREHHTDPVKLQFPALPKGFASLPIELPSTQSKSEVWLEADKTMPAGTHPLKLIGLAKDLRAEATCTVTIVVPKPIVPIVQAPKLTLKVPDQLKVQPGKSLKVEVEIASENLTTPAEVHFTLNSSKLKLTPTIAKLTESKGKVSSELKAEEDAPPGRATLIITAQAGQVREVKKLEIIVEIPAALKLTHPAELTLEPGSRKAFQVKGTRQVLEGAIQVEFSGGPKGIQLKLGEIPANRSEAAAEVLVLKDVPEGSYTIKVVGKLGTQQAMSTLLLRVQKKVGGKE